MSSKAFELVSVIDQIEFEPGEKVETLEFSVGSLYVGTTIGTLVHYGLETRLLPTGRTQFLANKLAQIHTYKSKITFLSAAPAINRLLLLCDSTLYILNLADLTVLNMAGSGKLKGVTVCCINHNPITENPFSIQICVAKKKQIAVLTLTEDKLSVDKTRDCVSPVHAMCMDGVFVCAALAGQYVIYNMDTGGQQELFPIELGQGQVPSIARIGKEEFLIDGPGGLGMFVKSTGISERPPLQWNTNLSHVVYCHPYVIGLSHEFLMVYSIIDLQLKQVLNISGGRFLGNFDGTLLAVSSTEIVSVAPIPWQDQVEGLLAAGSVEEALQLAEGAQFRGGGGGQAREEVDRVRQMAGFVFLDKAEFDKAHELLIQGKADVREIISLFPGLLPSQSKFVRSSPPLHAIPDITKIGKSSSEVITSAKEFLLSYLEAVRISEGSTFIYSLEVDTAMLKLLAELSPSNLIEFVKQENICLSYEDCEEFLILHDRHHASAILHLKNGNEDSALATWGLLLAGQVEDQFFPGLEFFARKLTACSDTLIWLYSDVVLKKDQQLGAKIFMKQTLDIEKGGEEVDIYVNKVLNFLDKYSQARRLFLKFLVFEKGSQNEKHHTQLAMSYLDAMKNEQSSDQDLKEASQNLRSLILSSKLIQAQFLLQHLQNTDFHYEQAILHGKMGNHDNALNILVKKLGDPKAAETYCDDISSEISLEMKPRLLFKLLEIFLDPNTSQEEKEINNVLAIDLLNSRARDMNGPAVLRSLPASWNIATILPALRAFSREMTHGHRMSAITKSLAKGESIQVRQEHIRLVNQPVYFMETNYCVVCQKSFAHGGMARYPNGVTLHQDCVQNIEVCPLTGTVFKINK